MANAICLLSVVPMRKEAAHRSEMVSQLLFGEYAEVLEEGGDFTRVKTLYDGYEGWVQTSQLTFVTKVLHTDLYLAHWSERLTVNGQYRHVPLGSPLYAASGAVTFGTDIVQYELPPSALRQGRTERMDAQSLLGVYSLFLHTPYLWGGKSVFGIDCSGFAQQV
ncbi:MAG: NlpC/P60 family protein, partial [Flaviaesturariibacter sp.]|nr:NlpC/P60 family protein [Flaviaesturariibacter sp.]